MSERDRLATEDTKQTTDELMDGPVRPRTDVSSAREIKESREANRKNTSQ